MSRPIDVHPFSWIGLFYRILAIALIALLWITIARGQDASTGAIRGVVKDKAGALIRGATVALVNVATGVQHSTLSNADGAYVFDLLPPGEYSARAEAPAMSPQTTPVLRVEIGGAVEINFELSVAAAKETVTISGAPPL